ncbi:unnamed protein product [Polarella glacialis]|uniref:EF-hand domain-containing protein n=2 Tax=Polarella glacialis TaxID=89957 RepID=A0A813JJ47_POLGL|nr:unnamed protein product [Polarella glacialis]
MKLEDLYPDGAEPWWNECDKPADSEQRVMFDHESFWMTGAEPDLKKRRKENPLIPEHGYFTSSVFSNFPDDSFGIKRYVLKKPDGSHTRVDLNIQVKHVMPLMRYTSSFKVNVPVDNLELPNATTLRIVLGASKKGEEYNYCVDRATTLISIGVLASNPSGPVSATVFLAVKTLTFLNRWYVSYKSDEYEEEGEEGEEAEEDAPAETGEEANFLGTTTEGSRPDQKTLWQAFREVDISVLFLQCCTLALLAVGQYGGMPAPLCAVACIVVCSTTMLYMNLATFQKEMEKNLQRFANTMVTGYKTAQQVSWRAQEWLNGENPFGIQFVKFESQVADKSSAATEINFIVPELGLVLSGKPKVDESLPMDEKKRQQMTKQVAYYIHKPTNVSDKRPKSVRDNSRFEFDISNGFCVALDIAQLKLCKPIPQIRATIQCVNHNESRICRQEFDSFITLYFPGDWDGEEEPSFATPEGKKKIEELLSTWKMQVDSWMEGTLGAVTTARTLTSKIQHHIESLLKAPYIGSTIRNVVKMKIAHILLPSMAKSTCLLTLLEDRMVYATCIYDSESPLSAVPKGRMSLFGRLKKFAQLESSKASLESFEAKLRNDADDDVDETLSKLKPESIEWMVQMDDYFDIPLPAAVNKVRLMFWVQDFEGKTEDLLGFTDEFDLRGMVRQQDDEEEDGENPSAAPGFFQAKSTKDLEDEERLWLHTRWTANSRANTLEPEKADEIISAEDMTRWQSLKQWASSFYSVPVTKEDLQMSKGYVDIVVKGSLKHEQEMDVMDMLAVKDLVAGKSNMNQKKLERHTDRFFTFAKIFGVSVDRASITCVTAHIETMKNILQKQVSHEITADDGIRRSLQKRDGLTLNPNWKADVQAVISSLEKQVVEQETFLKANEMVVPGHKLEMRRIGTRITVPAHKTFQDTLEARLKEFQLAETLSSKNILHYVMLSEHVKPSKLWRPDAICPHVCSIVTAEFDDVTDVRLTGGAQSLEIAFKRQQHANAPDVPVMVHGRMGFKAEGLEGAEALWQGQKELWLYWDGASRWIISPFKGESAPYGPGQGQAPEHFMWVQDPANSPEKVNQSWMVWKENVNHPKGGLWQQDLSIRILSNFIGKKQETRADVLLAQVEDDDLGVKGGLMDEILKSVRYLLVPSQSSKATPELKDCLLSLEGNNIGFAWKDFALEELAPFRKFLLGEFSTYQGIWLHLTRNSKIKRTLLQRNLTKMLAESRVELAVAEKQEQEELARDAYRLEQEANDASAQQEMKKKRSAPPPKKGIMSMLGGGMFKSKAKSSANLTAGAEDVSQSISTSSKRPIEMESISGGNKDAMHKFLDALGSDEAAVGEAVNKIVDALDSNKDGLIMVAEVAAFLNSTFQDELLCDMQVFFQVHPSWQKIENAWAEMSEDFEVSRFEFANAIKDRMDKFAPLAKEDKNSKEKADKLFAKFDVQMSEGISLTELIPVSGDDPSDVDQSMVKFLVPLNYIREIRIEGARQVGLEEKRTMRFQVNKQFETSKEWNELRKGLNPEWEPNPGFESLQVTMMPLHLEMWKQVIKDCGMTDAQEWIRFYDGAIEDHPELANTFLRQGEGIQRWTDGRTYKGQWEYHAYAGEGKLYATHEDMKSNARPLYEGQWKDGKRNGSGILRWEQDISERRRKATFSDKQFAGVGKVYEGNFRDDLFHGRGKLKLANAVAQRLPGRTMSNSESTTGAVPYPNTEATQLLSFDGYFDSDWLATYKAVTEHDTMFLNSHPKDTKDLALQKVSKREGTHRTDRYVKYFDLDAAQCQKSGQAMPDLAIAMYQHRNGDALHLKKGTALFADGSTYEGPFEGGLPHGQGIVTQYDAGKKLAWYEGQWSGGKFHGEGTHASADGVEYKGGWADGLRSGVGAVTVRRDIQDALGYVSYKGQFANDKFDGTGELVFGPQGACLYEGEFKDGNREGKGAIYSMDPSKALRTHGLFQKDVFATTMTDQCWVHLSLEDNRGRFFYGLLTKDGNIGIFGTLYDEDAGEDEDFMECFKKGVKYEVEDPRKPETLKYTQYCGAFNNNMAHGTGVQHFEGSGNGANGGNYVGDFMDGKRHGRGTWTTKKDWVYRPITSENVPNWENDLMHGIAIVEDKDHVHENVIYTKGTCQMPFTEAGPPKTGFDASGLTQALPDVARKRQFNLPLPTLKDQGGGISSFLGRVIRRKDEGWDPEVEMKYLQLLGSFPSSRIGLPVGQLDRSKTAGSNLSLTNSTAGDVGQTIAFVREPTDLSMPEEDVMISGGTGVNEELNGVYFKLTGTFGVKAFKMVKVQSGAYVARYLYKDVSANVWCISPKPLTGICVAPGCAFADDEKADHPGVIKQPWFVWHSFSRNLKSFGDTVAESGEGNFFTGSLVLLQFLCGCLLVWFLCLFFWSFC